MMLSVCNLRSMYQARSIGFLFALLVSCGLMSPAYSGEYRIAHGESLVLNWDFTSPLSPNLGQSVEILMFINRPSEIDPARPCKWSLRLFPELDAGGTPHATSYSSITCGDSGPRVIDFDTVLIDWTDGIFSVEVEAEVRDLIITATAELGAFSAGQSTIPPDLRDPTVAGRPIPVPGSLPLIGLGLAALGLHRRYRRV